MVLFVTIDKGWKALKIVTKSSILETTLLIITRPDLDDRRGRSHNQQSSFMSQLKRSSKWSQMYYSNVPEEVSNNYE